MEAKARTDKTVSDSFHLYYKEVNRELNVIVEDQMFSSCAEPT